MSVLDDGQSVSRAPESLLVEFTANFVLRREPRWCVFRPPGAARIAGVHFHRDVTVHGYACGSYVARASCLAHLKRVRDLSRGEFDFWPEVLSRGGEVSIRLSLDDLVADETAWVPVTFTCLLLGEPRAPESAVAVEALVARELECRSQIALLSCGHWQPRAGERVGDLIRCRRCSG